MTPRTIGRIGVSIGRAETPRGRIFIRHLRSVFHLGGAATAETGMHRQRELLRIEALLESLEREEELLRPKTEANHREPTHEHIPTKEDAGTLEDVLLSFQDATAEEIKLEIGVVEERKRMGRRKKASGTEREELRMHRNMELLKVDTLLESLELEDELLGPGTGAITNHIAAVAVPCPASISKPRIKIKTRDLILLLIVVYSTAVVVVIASSP